MTETSSTEEPPQNALNDDLALPASDGRGAMDTHASLSKSRVRRWWAENRAVVLCKTGVKRIAYRIFRLFGELSAIVLGLGFFWLCAINIVMAQRTVDVGFLEPNIARWFATAFEGKSADIGTMTIGWRAQDNAIVFNATDIAVKDKNGQTVQGMNAVRTELNLGDVVRAQFQPIRVRIDGGQITALRRADGTAVVGLGTPDTVGRFGPVWRSGQARQSRGLQIGKLEDIAVTRADIYILDKQDGLDIRLPSTALVASLQSDGVAFNIDTKIIAGLVDEAPDGANTSHADVTATGTFRADLSDVDLTVLATSFNPARILPRSGALSAGRALNAPLDFTSRIKATAANGLTVLDVDVTAGRGVLTFGGRTDVFSDAQLSAQYDVAKDSLIISNLSIESEALSLTGSAALGNIGNPARGFFNETAKFDLALADLRADMTDRFDAPFDIKSVDAAGLWNTDNKRLKLDRVAVDFGDYQFTGSSLFDFADDNKPEMISADLELGGVLTRDALLSLWPTQYILGARDWIDNSILQGDINDMVIALRADAEALAQPYLPNEALNMRFRVTNGAVRYIRTMTPATEAVGQGLLEGNRATFTLETGRVGDIALSNGIVEIPVISPPGGPLTISADGKGAANDLLALIDQKPFEYVSQYGVDPQSFTGQGAIRLTLTRPLRTTIKYSDITYSVTGTMTDITAPFAIGDYKLTDGDVTLQVDTQGLSVKGPVKIGSWNADLAWSEIFDNGATPTRYSIEGPVGRDDLDNFGIGLREYVSGSMALKIDAIADGLEISSAMVNLDLTEADMRLGPYWSKAPGTRAAMTGEMALTKAAGFSLKNIEILAPGLDVAGAVDLGQKFRLINLNLTKAKIAGFIDASVQVKPTQAQDRFDVFLTGDYLDVSPMVSGMIQQNSASAVDVPILLTAALRRLALNEAYVLRDTNVLFAHDGVGVTQARLKGRTVDGEVIASLTTNEDEMARRLRLDIPNASDAAFALFGIDSLLGGRLQIDAEMPLSGIQGPIVGETVIDDVRIIEAPIMTRILSLASLQGLSDALGGEGLSFVELDVPFSLDGQVLSVRGGRAAGPALGMTAEGEIDFAGKTLDIDGVLVPAYTANSLLGSIPLIGDIVVGKRGEGIFALSYTVRGPFDKSQVAVNPLSALTPGFLRGIFRPQRDALPEQVLKAIEDVTPKRGDAEPPNP